MKLTLLYFARFRETFGHDRERIELMPGTVDDLLAALRLRGHPWSDELVAGRAFRVAVNQDTADGGTALADGDEVALFPPVAGS